MHLPIVPIPNGHLNRLAEAIARDNLEIVYYDHNSFFHNIFQGVLVLEETKRYR